MVFQMKKFCKYLGVRKHRFLILKKKIDFSLHLEILIHVQENFNPKLLICILPGTVLKRTEDLRMKLK